MDRSIKVENFFGQLRNGYIDTKSQIGMPTRLMYSYVKNEEEIYHLRKNGFDINEKDASGKNALCFVKEDNFQLLIENGIDIHNITNKGKNILWYTKKEHIDYYLNNGVDINHLNNKGENALFSCKCNCAKEFLNKGINKNQINVNNENALFYSQKYEKGLTLINEGLNLYQENNSGIFAFTRLGKNIDNLIKKGINFNLKNKNGVPAFFSMLSDIKLLHMKNVIDINEKSDKGNVLFSLNHLNINNQLKKYLINKNIDIIDYYHSGMEKNKEILILMEKKFMEQTHKEKEILFNILNEKKLSKTNKNRI